MIISSVRREAHSLTWHTAHGTRQTTYRVITAANQNVPEATQCSRGNRHILTVRGTAKHQGASHSAAEEHCVGGGMRCSPRSESRLLTPRLTRQAMRTHISSTTRPNNTPSQSNWPCRDTSGRRRKSQRKSIHSPPCPAP